ncbi:MAG: hypothetical protein ABI193_12525, partial [Minicystis sp.]
MRTTWILASIATLAAALPLACGSNGTTGSGAAGTTSTTGTTGTGGSGGNVNTSASTGSGGTGGALDCGGVLTAGDCDTCGEANCCKELGECKAKSNCVTCFADGTGCTVDNQPLADALLACLQNSCTKECDLGPKAGDATCEVAPSFTGACVTLDAKVKCNPVTNEPCNTAAGEACDLAAGNA